MISNSYSYFWWFVGGLLVWISGAVLAASTQLDATAITPVSTQTTPTQTSNIAANASVWQLTPQEWQHYQQLMQGPAKRWYTKLNPPEVLGILADNDADRAHYAELVVKQRKARLDHELAFNRAVHTAWLRLYPRLKPIARFDVKPFRRVKVTAKKPKH